MPFVALAFAIFTTASLHTQAIGLLNRRPLVALFPPTLPEPTSGRGFIGFSRRCGISGTRRRRAGRAWQPSPTTWVPLLHVVKAKVGSYKLQKRIPVAQKGLSKAFSLITSPLLHSTNPSGFKPASENPPKPTLDFVHLQNREIRFQWLYYGLFDTWISLMSIVASTCSNPTANVMPLV